MEGMTVSLRDEAATDAVEAMEVYLRTGGVPREYLDRVLGDQSVAVSLMPQNSRGWDPEADRRRQEFYEKMRSLPPSAREIEMYRFYEEHGYFRPEDLRWFLGDPMRGVSWSEEGARSLLGNLDCN